MPVVAGEVDKFQFIDLSRQNVFHHTAVHIRHLLLASADTTRKFLVIQAKKVKDGSVRS